MNNVSWLYIFVATFANLAAFRVGGRHDTRNGSKLSILCPADNLIGVMNYGKDIFGLCVKPFVCGQHLLNCVPSPCGNGDTPFTFVNGAKNVGPSLGDRRMRSDATASNIKSSCCKTEETIDGQQLYEFTQFYAVFDDDNSTFGNASVDAYALNSTPSVYGGEYIKSIMLITGGFVIGTGYIQCDNATTEAPSNSTSDIADNDLGV